MDEALIFDLDGTLVDSLRGIADSLNRSLEQEGFPTHPDASVRSFIGNGARILVTRAAPAGSPEAVINALEARFKLDYEQSWPSGTSPYQGIPGLLDDLQQCGAPLAVLSNKPHPFTREIVRMLFPGISFSMVLGQRPGVVHKPDPSGALEIAASLHLPPARCTLIGDSTVDLETARRAGMKSIAVSWGYHDRGRLIESSPDEIADDIPSLRGLLAGRLKAPGSARQPGG